MIRVKTDLLALLKSYGYTSYKIRKERLIGEALMTKLRSGQLPSWSVLDFICKATGKQPGDLLEYVDDDQADHD